MSSASVTVTVKPPDAACQENWNFTPKGVKYSFPVRLAEKTKFNGEYKIDLKATCYMPAKFVKVDSREITTVEKNFTKKVKKLLNAKRVIYPEADSLKFYLTSTFFHKESRGQPVDLDFKFISEQLPEKNLEDWS